MSASATTGRVNTSRAALGTVLSAPILAPSEAQPIGRVREGVRSRQIRTHLCSSQAIGSRSVPCSYGVGRRWKRHCAILAVVVLTRCGMIQTTLSIPMEWAGPLDQATRQRLVHGACGLRRSRGPKPSASSFGIDFRRSEFGVRRIAREVARETRSNQFQARVCASDDDSCDEPAIAVNIAALQLDSLIEEHHSRCIARLVSEGLTHFWTVDAFEPDGHCLPRLIQSDVNRVAVGHGRHSSRNVSTYQLNWAINRLRASHVHRGDDH